MSDRLKHRAERRTNPAGRLDVLAFRFLERALEPKLERHPLLREAWQNGLKQIAECVVAEVLPGRPVLPRPRRRLSV